MATKPAYKKTEQRRRELTRCTVVALCPYPAHYHCRDCNRRFCQAHLNRSDPERPRCPCCGGAWGRITEYYTFG